MSAEAFEQFRTRVLADVSLQENLRYIEDKDEFIVRVVELGEREGYVFSQEDVQNATRENQQAWIERWM